jgi:hypothetical protein
LQEIQNSSGLASLGVLLKNDYFGTQIDHVALAGRQRFDSVSDLMGDGRVSAADTKLGRVIAVLLDPVIR